MARRGFGGGGSGSGGGWFEPSRPIRVEGGIRVRNRRGSIGEQWWSRRFVDILEEICDAGRLSRGRSYARSGQVLDVEVAPGLVSAQVQGSRRTPYRVTIEIEAYDQDEWRELVDALAAQALHRAKLLAGEMPPEIEEVFDGCGLPLFPDDELGLDMECSCPDWGFPCKHLSAVLYVLAEAFDDDPFLVLAWRGMSKEALLDALRQTGGGGGDGCDRGGRGAKPGLLDVTDIPFTDRIDDFYEPGATPPRPGPLPESQSGTRAESPPDLLLRALDPPPVKARHIPILDLLRPAYRTLSEQSTTGETKEVGDR